MDSPLSSWVYVRANPTEPRKPASIYEVDDIICDRYRLLKKQGGAIGHGTIFFCLDLWDRTPCVLKEIPAQYYAEAWKFATIPLHPNIVKLRRLEVVGGSVIMVQDWLPNDVFELLCKKISGEQIKEIILSVCRGLAHCIRYLSSSDSQYVHGDIKPENIFIAADGVYKLADFGGGYTEPYAAPEQINHDPLDHRTDVFLVGRLMKLLAAACIDVNCKNKYTALAEACMEPNPNDRLQSVNEIYRRLCGSDMEEGPFHRETTEQLRNLTLIGKQINVYQLADRLKDADADELCSIADVLLNINLPELAIHTLGMARFRGESHRVFAGFARAYLMLHDWNHAILTSTEALKRIPTDYRSMYVQINALYNKAVSEDKNANSDSAADGSQTNTKRAYIDFAADGSIKRETFSAIAKALETIHKKFPAHQQPMRLLGYVYNVLGERQDEIRCYQAYLATDKDDYETRFYYATALYLEYDTTKAIEQFRLVAEYIEKAESRSLGRGVMLAYCRYYLQDAAGFQDALRYIEKMMDLIPEEKKHEYEYFQFKDVIITDCYIHDEDHVLPYFDRLSELAYKIKAGFSSDVMWCRDQLRNIRAMRNEWNRMRYSSISIKIRRLNILSYDYETYFYEQLGDDEALLAACDKMLGYDISYSVGLYNKAVVLNRLGMEIESIPLYRKAFRCESKPDRKKEIKLEEKRILISILEQPDAFYEMLLKKASTWYGGRPLELEALIRDYCPMFTGVILKWLYKYSTDLIDKLLCGECMFDSAIPLLSLLEALHDAVIPEFSENEDPKIIEISITPNVASEYYLGWPANLGEVSLRILDMLIEAAEKSRIPFFLFNCLRLRGGVYYDRQFGDHADNLEKAKADFQHFLMLPESRLPESAPHTAWAAHYLGKIYMERAQGYNCFQHAREYLGVALSIYQSAENHLNEARVLVSQSIYYFKQENYSEAGVSASKALEKITLAEDRVAFGRAKYILGHISVLLTNVGNKHEREIINEGIDAFENVMLVFCEGSPEWFISMDCLARLYHASEERFHDGSWAMEQYYQNKKSSYEKKDSSIILDFLGQIVHYSNHQ